MSVNSELDELLSDAAPAAEVITTQETTQESQQQARDESGRFASKSAEQPSTVQQPTAETQPVIAATEQPPAGGVPVSAVQDERKKRQAAEADAETLRREIAELRGMVMARQQPTPAPQPEKQPVSIFENPDEYVQSQLSPLNQTVQELREELWESRAAALHTPDAVTAAKEAADALDPASKQALHRQITTSGNPFENLVKWHKQQQAIAKVGNDPDAWFASEYERRLNDPAEQARIMERIRASAASNTNRTQPTTSFPPSLGRLPAGGNMPADDDASDAALFSHATR